MENKTPSIVLYQVFGEKEDPDYEDLNSICPYCSRFGKTDECDLAYEDYTDRMMLWCQGRGCYAYSVMNLFTDWEEEIKKYQFFKFNFMTSDERFPKDVISHLPKVKGFQDHLEERMRNKCEWLTDFGKKPGSDQRVWVTFYRVPLIKVSKIINSELSDYYSKTPIEQEKIRDFIKSNYSEDSIPEGVKVRDDSVSDCDEIDFNVSLHCDTYNLTCPVVDYPKHFYLDHGGVYIFLLLETGEKMRFWGD